MTAVCAAVGLLTAGCGTAGGPWLFGDNTQDTTTPITAGGESGEDIVDLAPCWTDDLTVMTIGGDGAGGHTVNLFAFSTDGERCQLSEPTSAVVIGGVDEVPRGTFFPMRPFGPVLEPGEQAVIAVETTSCDVDTGPHGLGVRVPFDDGHTAGLQLRSDGCNLRWTDS